MRCDSRLQVDHGVWNASRGIEGRQETSANVECLHFEDLITCIV